MMINFKNISYLKSGNQRQQLAWKELEKLDLFTKLKKYKPLLAGTIPIDIDIKTSDLDIICECYDHNVFSRDLKRLFGNQNNFELATTQIKGIKSTIGKFNAINFPIEIFGQAIPSENQPAFQHLLIEHKILDDRGEAFKKQIRDLKDSGMKTEPAFALLLGLEGDPYDALLRYC